MATELLAWFRGNGGYLHPKVAVQRQSDGKGLRLVWSETTETRERLIVRCPDGLVFSILQIPVLAPWWPTEWVDSYDTTTLTRFLLVEAFLQHSRHLFDPYIESLPQPRPHPPFSTPIFWDAKPLKIITGTNLYDAATDRKQRWEREFAEATEHLLRLVPDRFFHIKRYTADLYLWAATVLSSRCFPHTMVTPAPGERRDQLSGSSRGQNFVGSRLWARWVAEDPLLSFPVLIPVFDLANHSPEAEVRWVGSNNTVKLFVDCRNSAAGVEIFNNYGQKSNDELILGYGFDLTPNAANAVLLRLSEQPEALTKIHWVRELALKNLDSSPSALPLPHIFNPSSKDLPALYALREGQEPLSSAAATPLAFMTMNTREQRARLGHPFDIPNFSTQSLPTRQGLETLIAFASKLRILTWNIEKNNWLLPSDKEIAASSTMQMASRYRESQLKILHGGLASLRRTMTTWQKTEKVVSLEDILTSVLARPLLKKFRHIAHCLVGTRDWEKVRKLEWQEPVFVSWVIFLIAQTEQPDFDDQLDPDPKVMMPRQLRTWLAKMKKAYGDYDVEPLDNLNAQHTATDDKVCWTDADRANVTRLVPNYEQQLRDQAEFGKLPRLRSKIDWALRVIREETVWLPDWLNTTMEENDGDGPQERVMAMVLMEPEGDE